MLLHIPFVTLLYCVCRLALAVLLALNFCYFSEQLGMSGSCLYRSGMSSSQSWFKDGQYSLIALLGFHESALPFIDFCQDLQRIGYKGMLLSQSQFAKMV